MRAAEPEDFYARHLLATSRSFAPCIAQLGQPLRDWVGLGYLLCRLFDTVEDAPWQHPAAQADSFAALAPFIAAPPSAAKADAWAAALPPGIRPAERALAQDAEQLFGALHALPPAPQRAMQAMLQRMLAGMGAFAQHRDANGHVRLRSLGELNRYCFVVAGVVGQLLTELLACSLPSFRPSTALKTDAVHFGLFLQKLNLLKDRRRDAKEGRFWLPDSQLLLPSLHRDAQGAGRYLLALPAEAASFRLFCAWSLFLGARSVGLYDGQAADGPEPKLPRAATQALFEELRVLVADPAALRQALTEAFALLPPAQPTQAAVPAALGRLEQDQFDRWLALLGPTQLSYPAAQQLGMA